MDALSTLILALEARLRALEGLEDYDREPLEELQLRARLAALRTADQLRPARAE